jgi:hypothetical protein
MIVSCPQITPITQISKEISKESGSEVFYPFILNPLIEFCVIGAICGQPS